MDPHSFAQAVNALETIIVFGMASWAFVSVARTRQGRVKGAAAPQQLSGELDARMERLERATAAIALRVERIAEGQRFVTKLLADPSTRAEGRAAAYPSSDR